MAPKKPRNWGMLIKMMIGCSAIVVGGPALTYYIMPTEEELVKRYNPELQKKNLLLHDQRQQEFEEYVSKLKEYAKSDKPIWVLQAEEAKRNKKMKKLQEQRAAEEAREKREAMRREMGLPIELDK